MHSTFSMRLCPLWLAFFFGCISIAYSQTNVYNYGTVIRIEQNAQVTITGNYEDQAPASSLQLDAPVSLSGTLRVGGNLVNNNGKNAKLIYNFNLPSPTGQVIMTGTGNNSIGGAVPIFFPNLEINKAGTATLGTDINIFNNLTLTSGSVDLNGHVITLEPTGTIVGENTTNTISGSAGSIVTSSETINTGASNPNFHGIGIGFSGAANFSSVVFQRVHGTQGYALTDGTSILRLYKMTTAVSDDFDQLTFRYHSSEANGLVVPLAFYVSNNNGANWVKVNGLVDAINNIVTVNNVPIQSGSTNILAISIANCVTNLPDATITSPSAPINSLLMDICDQSSFELDVPFVSGYTYVITPPNANPVVNTNVFNRANIGIGYEGVYQSFVRTPRGCENTYAINVDVRDNPVAAFSITPDPNVNALCFNNQLTFNDLSTTTDGTTVTGWTWKFNDINNSTSSNQTAQFTYPSTGPQVPSLVVTSQYGCTSNTATKAIVIQTLPTPNFDITDGATIVPAICEDIDVNFINQSTYLDFAGVNSSSLSYDWSFGDLGTSTATSPVHPYNSFGNYTINLKVTVIATGCINNVSHSLVVKPEPIVDFTSRISGNAVTEACPGIYITMDNTSTMPDASAMTYSWDFGDGTSSTVLSPSKEYLNPGLYTQTLTVSSVVHGCFESLSLPMKINPSPEGTFAIDKSDICIAENAAFTNNSTILNGTMSYQWDFGDGNSSVSPLANVTHSYLQPMQYKVTLTRTSDKLCTNSVSKNLVVHPTPIPSFGNLNVCEGLPVNFFNSSIIQSDGIESYSWDFGDNTSLSTAFQPSHLFGTYGDYNVSLFAKSTYGCTNQVTKIVSIYRKPSFDLGASITACGNNFVLDPSTAVNKYLPLGSDYTWYNSSAQLIGATPQLQVSASGVYSITIQTQAPESCSSTTNLPLFLFKPADLGPDLAACSQVILDAENGLAGEKSNADQTLYEWRKNGNIVSSLQALTVTETGDYTIKITRIKNGNSCSSSDIVHVDIELPLTITLPPQITICEGQPLTLDAGVIAQNYTWTNLSTGAIIGTQQTLGVSASGIYRVEVTNSSCTAVAVSTVTFSAAPVVSFGVSSIIGCTAQDIVMTDYTFTDVGNVVSTTWDFGDNSNASNQVVVNKQYASPGDYIVSLSATTNNGCQNVFSQTVTIRPTPVVDFTIQNACEDKNVIIQNNSTPGNASVVWDFGDQTTSTFFNPLKSFKDAGSYNVKLSATLQGCSSNTIHSVTIQPTPILEFGNLVTTCGSNLILDAGNVGSTYRWFNPNNNLTLSSSQQFAVSVNGQIGLDITSAAGCTITDVADVQLNTPLVVSLGVDRPVCDFEELDGGYFPAAQYSWSTGANTRTIKAITSGLFTVSVIDQNGCTGGASVTLQVDEKPLLSLGTDKIICESDPLTLTAGTNSSYVYSWSTGATSSSIPVVNTGSYAVTVTNGTCSVNQSINVTVNPLPQADFSVNDACQGQAVVFTNQSLDAGDGALTYHWDFGDGTISSLKNPSKQYSSSGSYSVKLKATTPANCYSEKTRPAKINVVPLALFSVVDACTSNNINITNTSTYSGTSGLSWQWDFGNGDISTAVTPVYAYQNPGAYVVNLIISSTDGCSDNYVQTVNVGSTPSLANWVSSYSSCNNSVLLDAGNIGSTYLWSDNTMQQTLSVSTDGNYSVSISSPDGCSINAQANVSFKNQVQPVLDNPMQGCGSVFIDPKVNAATYLWSTGEQTKTIVATTSNTYSVQVISADLCTGNASTNVSVYPVPVVNLGSDRDACEGETISLVATSALPVTYSWSTGESTDRIGVTNSGVYNATLTSANGCVSEDEVAITFHAIPVLTLANSITACGNVNLDAGNSGSSYMWSTGSVQQVISASATGIYDIKVTNIFNCSNSQSVVVTILPLPAVELGPDLILCNGVFTTLDAGTNGVKYLWSEQSTSRYLRVGSSGNYQVVVTDGMGCSSTDQIKITIRPPLALELGPDRLQCKSEGISISAGVDQVNYQWGSNTNFTSQQKDIVVDKVGTYWLKITDSYLCTASDTVKISATTQTIAASFLIPTVVDVGDIVHFAQLTEPRPLTFSWDFGDGGTSGEENPVHRYFRTGEFQPTLIVSNGVCTDKLVKSITVRQARTKGEPIVALPQLIDFVNLNLYPNPVTDIVRLDIELTTEAEVMTGIYSLEGVTLMEQKKIMKEGSVEFDLVNVSEGVYLLRVITENNKAKVIKVIKVGRN